MPVAEPQMILPENYRFLQQHVYAESGIVLEENKHYLFECRLTPVAARLGLRSINQLCDVLRENGRLELRRNVVEAMTTNETYFFRDPAHYEAIRTCLLPRLRAEIRNGRRLRFWSAAASTGQEAYSLAMVLLEEGFTESTVEIFATDFSSCVVQRARSARYQQIEVNRGLPVTMLVKYLTRIGVDWQLRDDLRRMVRFEQIDLRKELGGLGTFDLIFCRNVMIYFDAQTRLRLLEQLHCCLARGGWLLLGGAETSSEIDRWFERRTIANATIYEAK
jgi:chemotaxis protein methyltransferase CheR